MLVALGFVVSEVGVLFGVAPVAVGGLLLLAGSVVGVVRESGYARTLWRPALLVGAVVLVAGGLVVGLTTATLRGTAVAVAGGLVVAAAAVAWLVETGRL